MPITALATIRGVVLGVLQGFRPLNWWYMFT